MNWLFQKCWCEVFLDVKIWDLFCECFWLSYLCNKGLSKFNSHTHTHTIMVVNSLFVSEESEVFGVSLPLLSSSSSSLMRPCWSKLLWWESSSSSCWRSSTHTLQSCSPLRRWTVHDSPLPPAGRSKLTLVL